MKKSLILCFITLLSSPFVMADQSINFPENAPQLDVAFPDDWELKPKDGVLFAHPKDDSNFFMELSKLEADKDHPDEAMEEAKASIEDSFKNVTYDEKPTEGENPGVTLQVLNAKGEDEEGKANINLILANHTESGDTYMLLWVSSSEAFEKHAEIAAKVIESIEAHGGDTNKGDDKSSDASDTQTYSYPDKDKPLFAIDFPADWHVTPDSEGAYVESPDKLVAMNVLLIDQGELDVAVEKMKKDVGAKYESIVWNEGKDPEVAKDDALGVTATYNNGQAEAKGVKYFVNFVEYVKKDGEKFLVVINQAPKKALETHADALEKTIKSIKVK